MKKFKAISIKDGCHSFADVVGPDPGIAFVTVWTISKKRCGYTALQLSKMIDKMLNDELPKIKSN